MTAVITAIGELVFMGRSLSPFTYFSSSEPAQHCCEFFVSMNVFLLNYLLSCRLVEYLVCDVVWYGQVEKEGRWTVKTGGSLGRVERGKVGWKMVC